MGNVRVRKSGTWKRERLFRAADGYTFVELIVVAAIIMILAAAAMPLARVTAQRQRRWSSAQHCARCERRSTSSKTPQTTSRLRRSKIKAGSEGYPADLEVLVEGIAAANDATGRKLKFLRRIPIDPMTKKTDWALRSYQDDSDSTHWGGQNVFDVRTTFEGTALDGTKYRDW